MEHSARTFARRDVVMILLTLQTISMGAVSEKSAGGSVTSLEALRKTVLANEAKANLLRMEYKCWTELSSTIPKLSARLEKSEGKSAGYLQYVYAQDGQRFHRTSSTYEGTQCVHANVFAVDGEVCKSGRLPALMEGYISRVDKFTWGDVVPIQFAFRPFGNRFLLSDCLLPQYASVRENRVMLNGRAAMLVDINEPREGSYYHRVWIDLERGLPLRMEFHDPGHPDNSEISESTKFHQLPNGGWITVEGDLKQHTVTAKGYVTDLTLRCKVDVNSVSIDKKDIPDSLFDIKFPPGARILNEIVGVVPPKGGSRR